MAKNHWDAILAARPVNRLAATVTSKGESYEPNVNSKATFWDERPELLDIRETMAVQPQFIDLTGMSIGRMVVVGMYADDPPSKTKKAKGALWVCRCACGRYQGVRAKKIKKSERDRCDYCCHTDDLRSGRIYEISSGIKVSSYLIDKLGYETFNSADTDGMDIGEDR